MFKTKLYAVICLATSTVVAASTALTLAISGPRAVQSAHALSPNQAVAQSITNLFSGTNGTFDRISEIAEAIASNKTAFKGSLTINSIEGLEDISGIGGGFELGIDGDNNAASFTVDASMGNMTVFNGTLYGNEKELLLGVPAFFDGVLKAPLDNLADDLNNSYIGKALLSSMDDIDTYEDLEEMIMEYAKELESMDATIPDFSFDYDAFYDRLGDVIKDSFQEVCNNMAITDLGKVQLNGGAYQGYRASISIKELSHVLKDVVKFLMTDEEFIDFLGEYMDYMSSMSGMDMSSAGFNINQLPQMATMVDSYWDAIMAEALAEAPEAIEFSIYLTDSVEIAGLDLFVGVMESGTITFNSNDSQYTDNYINFSYDLTGGSKIGDYVNIIATVNNEYSTNVVSLVGKSEKDGSFSDILTFDIDGQNVELLLEGTAKVEDPYFDYTFDTIKVDFNGKTVADIALSLSFQPVDNIKKPTGSKEYNIWEMDENDLEDLTTEIMETAASLLEILE